MTENIENTVPEAPEEAPESEEQISHPESPTSNLQPPTSNLQSLISNLQSPFFVLLALFLVFRLLTLLLLRPGGFIRDWSDFDTFLGIAAISDYGLYPFLHYWLEWPPLVPWLAVGAYQLSLLFPPWTDQRLWFTLILGSVFLLFETGNFVLLYRIARRLGGGLEGGGWKLEDDRRERSLPEGPPTAEGEAAETEDETRSTLDAPHLLALPALRVVVLYALLFAPVYAMLGFFDAIALFFLLLALDFTLRGRLLSSAIAVGVGFLVKLTPLIFVPVALRRLWAEAESRRNGLRDGALYLVATLLTVMALLLPFLLTQPAWLVTGARAVAGRSSWETVWAVLEGYFGFGVIGGDRLNPAETAFASHPASLPWALITLGFGLLYLLLWTRPADYRQPRAVVALTGLTTTLFLLYSKGYSPQFLVYLLPFIILLFPDWRGVTYSLILTLLNVLEQPIYFVLVPDARWLLEGVILARWLVLGVLLVEFGWAIWGAKLRLLTVLRRYAPAALAALTALGLVIALPGVGRAYAERRLSEEPAAPVIGYLTTAQARAETGVVLVGDQDLLRRVKPYVADRYDVRLAGGDNLYKAAPSAADLIAGTDKAWVVSSPPGAGQTGDAAARVQQALNGLGRWLLVYDFGNGEQLRLFTPRNDAAPLPPVARLSSGANLIGYRLEVPERGKLLVTLYWWATGVPTQNYTVFTQVLDRAGKLAAGHDGVPVNGTVPTYTWQAGRVYADAHLIELPPGLATGTYQVVAGMYDLNLTRLTATGQDAVPFPNSAVPLGNVVLP
jgi:hypothetical protein